ncbi:TPA: sulfatase family protein [Photobacterium damselae]|uniref:N-acetylgalactosamine 6-sulfate sulfatase (GALNS) n=4 Tax=Photobacterium damselae TaxID=38293 RepID=D0Z3R1_PHODD|nr:sulfatase-like hydrolase/transferase [Photobacterium damselae]AWK84199.1 arylsulfatase [Photobacterium damselae]EEZ40042.1 N-acetylgalactosamine 6-sulfate sulfatase (GALNS) [Photobacterium damselae subsp. damselae CIP 102761]EHA1080059.1 sulfatase-like hydrolase/transferase [Photobacterium damselae]EJN6959284.1 sulfatase-like hydrolase/transferase [Photobacterium damselae]EJN6962016.1 sulfatase-like hydrolase/transferase [Photobacterium damselae]
MNLSSTKKTVVASLVAAACVAAPVTTYAAKQAEQPNVLLVIMDDLGTGQLDFALDSLDKTELAKRPVPARYQGDLDKMIDAAHRAMPNVAKLAQNGVKMTNAFVAHPVCGPSRAGIFTGRYPTSFGTYSNDDALQGVPLDIKLLPALFQENGYRTANIGKWHNAKIASKDKVAEDARTRDYHDIQIPVIGKGFGPEERGFDYSYSFYASGAALWNSPAIYQNGKNIPAPGYLTHNLTNEALKFIEDSGDKPFFINLAYSVPHIPLEQASPAKYMDRFNTGNVEADKYFAAINAADEGLGQIMALLKQKGELDNTLIFFLSDNGAVHESPMPMNGMDRGFKGQMYNGGVRVPFVAAWPNHIPAGGKSDTLISALDILPTALKAAGISIPQDMKVDGQDIMPVLAGKAEQSPHKYIYWAGPGAKHYSEENDPFWYGYWKWITYESDTIPSNPNLEKLSKGSWAIRDQDWALYFYDDGSNKVKLFNDKLDPSESKDLAQKYPEKVVEMKNAFYDWIKDKPKPVAWGQDRYHVLTESAKPAPKLAQN